MSPSRRAALAGLAVALAGCGFRPLYAPGGGGRALTGAVRLEDVEGRVGYAFRRALRDRIGDPEPGAPYVLGVEIELEETGLAISSADDVTRYDVQGVVRYVLSPAGGGAPLAEGEAFAVSAYSTLASPYATRVARRDARERVARALADQVFVRLVAAALDDPA